MLDPDIGIKTFVIVLILVMFGFTAKIYEVTQRAAQEKQAPGVPEHWPRPPPDCRGLHDREFAACLMGRIPPPERQGQ